MAVAEKEKRGPFDPRRISPSRVDKLAKCGVAFKYQYLDGVPPTAMGPWALNGSVIHKALELWAPDRSQDLFKLVEDAWTTEGDTATKAFIQVYKPLAREVIRLCHDIKERRPEIQMPKRTGDFKKSEVARRLNALLAEWIPRLEKESKYRFDGDNNLPSFYEDSLVFAKRYQRRWQNRPAPFVTEFKFDLEWRGFSLLGYIDTVEPVIAEGTGEMFLGVIDYKTSKRVDEEEELKHYRQLVIYDVAVRALLDRGVLPVPDHFKTLPILVGVDYCSANPPERKFLQLGEADHDRLERELTGYAAIAEAGAFLPAARGTKSSYCDYPETCCQRNCAGAGGSATPVEVDDVAVAAA